MVTFASAHGMVVSASSHGTRFADGSEVLSVEGPDDVVMVRVSSIVTAGQLDQVGASLAGPERRFGAVQLLRDFPPTRPDLGELTQSAGAVLVPADELEASAHDGYQLIIGYEAGGDEPAVRTGIEIEYEVNGRSYIEIIDSVLVWCPSDELATSCADLNDSEVERLAGT